MELEPVTDAEYRRAAEAALAKLLRDERERCAELADAIVVCFHEHGDNCSCTGERRPGPSEIGRLIRELN